MALFAHIALQRHNILPSVFMAMPIPERAFIVASDMLAAERLKELEKRR